MPRNPLEETAIDVLSHALWGYAALRWRGPRTARWGALTGAAPDLLYAAASATRRVARRGLSGLTDTFGNDRAIWLKDGPPMPEELIESYWSFYVYTHSFIILGMLAIAWVILSRRAPWLLLPWALHIFMDIPSHERYLTPFLYPLSTFTVAGYAWSRPPMLLANLAGLLIAYGVLYGLYWRRGRKRGPDWPEDRAGAARGTPYNKDGTPLPGPDDRVLPD